MKKRNISKLLSIALTSCLIIGGGAFGNLKSVNASGGTLEINASDMNDGKCDYYENNKFRLDSNSGYSNVIINLDDNITFDKFYSGVDVVFSGTGSVLLNDDLSVTGDLTVNKDVTITTNAYHDQDIKVTKKSVNDNKGGNLYFYGKVDGEYLTQFIAEDTAVFDGASIKLNRCAYFFDYPSNLEINNSEIEIKSVTSSFIFDPSTIIKNSSIECETINNKFIQSKWDVTIENSDISVNKIYSFHGIDADGALSIDGNIYFNSYFSALHSKEKIDIKGGNLVLNSSKNEAIFSEGDITINCDYLKATSEESFAICTAGNISLGEKCYIKSPESAYIGERETVKSVLDADGEPCKSVEIIGMFALKGADISGVEDKTYTGQPITQSPVLTLNGTVLTEGKDYTVSYSDNTAVGTATITFKAVEGSPYCGETSVTFQITEAETNDKKDDDKKDDQKDDQKDDKKDDQKDNKKYSNEWVDGKWYDADGKQTYKGTMSWKSNDKGWWIEDSEGWYPQSQWVKIDGKWYYFCADGYMDYSEYRDGCWLGSDGAWVEEYHGGTWKQNSTGWWYEDASGWYPQSQWVWIDGSCYYFGADGYMLTNQYVDGYWIGSDGVCQ